MSASLPIIPDTTEERTLREVRKVPVRDFRNQKTRAVGAHLVLGQAAEFYLRQDRGARLITGAITPEPPAAGRASPK